MKRILSLALCLLLCLPVLAASAETADPVELVLALPYQDDSILSTLNRDNNDALACIYENTGVSLTVRSYDDLYNTLMLMFAAGTEPDIVAVGSWISGANELFTMLIEQDAIVDFTDVIAASPDRWPLISSFMQEGIWKTMNRNLFGDENKNFATYSMDGSINTGGAMVYYMPYLEKVGYTADNLPTTLDELHELLTAIKNADVDGNGVVGDTIPLVMNSYQGTTIGGLDYFWLTRGITSLFNVQVEYYDHDSYVFYPTREETKDVHRDIARYYSEGLLDAEFLTREQYANWTLGAAGQAAVISSGFPNVEGTFYGGLYEQMAQGGMPLSGPEDLVMDARSFVGENGETYRDFMVPGDCGARTVISHNCDNVEAALDVLEFLYSEKGQQLIFFGLEGISFEKDENGEPQITDLDAFTALSSGVNNPSTDNGVLGLGILHTYAGMYRNFERDGFLGSMTKGRRIPAERAERTDYIEYADGVAKEWADSYMIMLDEAFRSVSVTGGEWDEMKSELRDICWRYYTAWWTGQKDIDATWDSFVAECEAAGSVELEAEYNRQLEEAKAALAK